MLELTVNNSPTPKGFEMNKQILERAKATEQDLSDNTGEWHHKWLIQ